MLFIVPPILEVILLSISVISAIHHFAVLQKLLICNTFAADK